MMSNNVTSSGKNMYFIGMVILNKFLSIFNKDDCQITDTDFNFIIWIWLVIFATTRFYLALFDPLNVFR